MRYKSVRTLVALLTFTLGMCFTTAAFAGTLEITEANEGSRTVYYTFEPSRIKDEVNVHLDVKREGKSYYSTLKKMKMDVRSTREIRDDITFSSAYDSLNEGDLVRLTIDNASDEFRVRYDRYSYARSTAVGTPWPPTSLSVQPERIPRGESTVTFTFDKNYQPALGDVLQVDMLDKADKVLATNKVPLVDVRVKGEVRLQPKPEAKSYRFTYVGAAGNEAKLTQTVPVEGEPMHVLGDDAKKLTIAYSGQELTPGMQVKAPVVSWVDADGQSHPLDDAIIAVAGLPVDVQSVRTDGSFRVKDDVQPGAQVAVTAVSGHLRANTVLTVKKEIKPYTLSLTPAKVNVGETVDVLVQIKQNGQKAVPSWPVDNISPVVTGQASATIVDKSKFSSDGQLTVRLTGRSAEKIQLYLKGKDASGQTVTTEQAAFTFENTAQDLRTVTMFINNTSMLVNGKVQNIDTVPIVKENRTFVPFRALAQAFDAKVDFDAKTNTITTTMGKKVVVMTVGQTAFKSGATNHNMDVAPYIDGNNRTMVPVRFVAQALDFSVTPIYDSKGATMQVVFGNQTAANG